MVVARRERQSPLVTELVRHSVADERYVYPLLKEVLPDRVKLVEQEVRRLVGAERTMTALEGFASDAADFDRITRELVADMREYVFWEGRNGRSVRDRRVRTGRCARPGAPHLIP